MEESKKRRRLRIKWSVFELQGLQTESGALSLCPCAHFIGTKTKAQRWIRESGTTHIDYVILPVYRVEEVE